MNRYLLLWVIPVYLAFSGCFTIAQVEPTSADPSLDLVYYSDYFSFVGGDLYFQHRGGKPSTTSLNQDGFLVLKGQSNLYTDLPN